MNDIIDVRRIHNRDFVNSKYISQKNHNLTAMDNTSERNKNHRLQYIIFTYILCTGLFAVCLFLYGFFPIKHHEIPMATMEHIPKTVDNIDLNSDRLYKPLVQKVVVMVIDALRWDFVADAAKTGAMPVTTSLISNNSACLQKVKVNAPTVTMPRIKAMTTGTVSGFIDVALNFGETSVTSDSVLQQAKNHGHNLIFYGDDTWLKLYPDLFHRHEGTTSFFVSDYKEVDDNITRHIHNELHVNSDWSIMILHYLGLDHIGHLYGPQSALVRPKLQEMDKIISEIVNKINHWNNNNIPSLLFVCGDHGMKDSGGHGGATPEETLVPFIAFGTSCTDDNVDSSLLLDQVDIASTLAMILGIPLPSSSLGSVSLNLIKYLPKADQLFMLHYNAKHIWEQFKNIPEYKIKEPHLEYLRALQMHIQWLSASGNSEDKINQIIHKYHNAMKGMKDLLIQSLIHYNITVITLAITFMISVLLMLNCDVYSCVSLKKFCISWILSTSLWFSLNYLYQLGENAVVLEITDNFLALLIFILFGINCYLCSKISWDCLFIINYNYSNWKYPIAVVIHTLSLSSSSFVEEEHQTWYFFWVSFLLYEVYQHLQKTHLFDITQFNKKNRNTILKVLFVLVIHRILRKLNSTGNKYAHLPDISGWLKDGDSNLAMSLVLLLALGLLVTIGFVCTKPKHRKVTLVFYLILSLCIYLRHASTNTVLRPLNYPESRGIFEVQIFRIISVCYFVYSLRNIYCTARDNSEKLHSQLLHLFIQCWVAISALLHRPNNMILLPAQLITHAIIHHVLKSKNNREIEIYISYCLGNVFYFYQGNSNSLATIDVAAGYVGLETYILPIATLFLCINTYSAPILAYLMLLYMTTIDEDYRICEKILSINRRYSVSKFFPLAIYSIIMTAQRYHLFVWSVFSPKLLYEAMYCAVLFTVIIFTQIPFVLFNRN